MKTTVVLPRQSPNILFRLIWFCVCGWWLGAWVTALGYILCVSVIGLPAGLVLLNRLPHVMTLRGSSRVVQVQATACSTQVIVGARVRQRSFLLRGLYFFLIGWWFAALWLALAWVLVLVWLPTLGLSLALACVLFDRVPGVLTLRRT